MPQLSALHEQLERLVRFDPGPYPVVSLYLNLQSADRGRAQFDQFVRKELAARARTYSASGPEVASLEADANRIEAHLKQVPPSANGLAVFACHGAELFEAVPLAAPIDGHRLFISDEPHLYPLARLVDQYPRYLALVADTQSARIFVFAANQTERVEHIQGVKTKRHSMGGWSQARYQRHTENYHLHHAKEIVDAVARTMRDEGIDRIVLSGDAVILPLLREQMPKEMAAKIVDVLHLEKHASERDIVDASLAALQAKDSETDAERVEALLGDYRASGLACIGVEATTRAFELGQVDELVIAASPETITGVTAKPGDRQPDRTAAERAADALIAQAMQTSAKVRFIEDASLLADVGGVGAFLRYKL